MQVRSLLNLIIRKNEANQLDKIFPHFSNLSDHSKTKLKKLAQTLITRNFKLSTREAALICRISFRAFDEKFQEFSGYSYQQFATRLKVFRSKNMLERKVSSEDIVKELNFKNIDHFNSCYERVIGKKPEFIQSKKSG